MPKFLSKKVVPIHSDFSACPEVSLWDFSDMLQNPTKVKEVVSLIATLSHGNFRPKDAERLYNNLLKLGHESVLEFIRTPSFSEVSRIQDSDLIEDEYRYFVKGGLGIDKSFRNRTLNIGCFSNQECRIILSHNIATFLVEVPIYSARQIMRHRLFSYLELSRRYTKDKKVPFVIIVPATIHNNLLARILYKLHFWFSKTIYNLLLRLGIKPEDARAVMPLGTKTMFWMMGDYRAWLNFFVERLQPEAQEITRATAETMLRMLKYYQPKFVENMIDYAPEYCQHHLEEIKKSRKRKVNYVLQNYFGVKL